MRYIQMPLKNDSPDYSDNMAHVQRETWVIFAAAAMTTGVMNAADAAGIADKLMVEWDNRFIRPFTPMVGNVVDVPGEEV